MTLPALEQELKSALSAAKQAGDAAMRYFRRGEPVHYKAADQPVTEADLAANRILRERLMADRPYHGWLSEESLDTADRLGRERLWVVDPIDGTNSFVAGLPEFVVSVGLVEDGHPVVGVAYNPATGECFHAIRGAGAFLNGSRIRVVSEARFPARPAMYGSRAESAAGAFLETGHLWDVRFLGSTAYRMCRVAAGSAHAAWSGRTKHDWDICAAALIVTEAGGLATDAHGAALIFNRPVPTHAGVVASASASLPPFPDRGR